MSTVVRGKKEQKAAKSC